MILGLDTHLVVVPPVPPDTAAVQGAESAEGWGPPAAVGRSGTVAEEEREKISVRWVLSS